MMEASDIGENTSKCELYTFGGGMQYPQYCVLRR